MAEIPLPGGAPGQLPAGALQLLPAQPGPKALLTAPDLAALFAPGAVVTGRVVQALGSDQYLLAMRGANVVVMSRSALDADSVVRFQVVSTGAEVQLRLVDGGAQDHAQTTTSADRLQALGLPPGAASALALAAFEDAGAPLNRAPLLAAAAALSGQGADAGQAINASPAALAGALAALARAELPVTPATIALALRALDGALPAPAATLPAVQQAAAALLAELAPAGPGSAAMPGLSASPQPPSAASPALPPVADATAAPASTASGAAAAGATGTAAGPPSAGAPPAAGPLPPPTTLPASGAAPASLPSPGALSTPAAGATAMPAATTSSPGSGGSAATAGLPSTTPSAAGVPPVGQPEAGQGHAAAAGSAVASSPAASAGSPVLTAIIAGAGPSGGAMVSNPLQAAVPGAGAAVTLTDGTPLSALGALRAVIALDVPDATAGGAPAVLQALSLAGLRSGPASAPGATLLKHLAAALPPTMATAAPATAGGGAAAAQSALAQALVHAVRDGSASSVIKPAALADYDQVLAVPLQDQGAGVPTRLAVAARPAAGGTATYLRVDTELSHLGAVSVRLSGIEDGPMAITLLADGGGARALAEALPALAQGLQELGFNAGLRVASLAAEGGHG